MKIDEMCTEQAWYTSKDGTLTLSPKTGPILMMMDNDTTEIVSQIFNF